MNKDKTVAFKETCLPLKKKIIHLMPLKYNGKYANKEEVSQKYQFLIK